MSAKSPDHPQVKRVPTELVIRHVNRPAPDSEPVIRTVEYILGTAARKTATSPELA